MSCRLGNKQTSRSLGSDKNALFLNIEEISYLMFFCHTLSFMILKEFKT